MKTQMSTINGLDAQQMNDTVKAIQDDPSLARFQFRNRNRWINGGENRSTIRDFYGAGREDDSRGEDFVYTNIASAHNVVINEESGFAYSVGSSGGGETCGGGLHMIDIRDPRELDREGRIPGAMHAPRGMLEFWGDPESPYHKEILADDSKTYVLYCASGWRSALSAKALQDMGFDNIAHVDGGFSALKDAGALVREVEKK